MELKAIIEKVKTPNITIKSQIDKTIWYSSFSVEYFEENPQHYQKSDDEEHEDDFGKHYPRHS